MGTVAVDLRRALRSVRHRKALAAAVAATLALAIGANTAMFGVVHAVLLRPLPFPEPERILRLEERHASSSATANLTGANVRALRERALSLSHVAAYRLLPFNLSGESEPVAISAARVTPGFFDALGVRPLAGRLFADSEFEAGADKVVVLGERLWRSALDGDPGAVGRRLRLDGDPHLVIGVVADRLRVPEAAEAWLPMNRARQIPENRHAHLFTTLARLRGGVGLDEARRELAALAPGLRAASGSDDDLSALVATPLGERLTQGARPALAVLLAAVGLVLLVACANVASLMLARGASRMREMAVRSALGASRLQVVRQLLLESLVLAALGTAPGVLLAAGATRALRALAPAGLPRAGEIGLDATVLGFAVAMGGLAALLFGLWPALQAARSGEQAMLARGGRGALGPSRGRGALVVAEVALLVVLLGGAGVLARGFLALASTPLGFQPQGLVSFYVSPRGARYAVAGPTLGYVDGVLEALRALPGVREAVASSALPTRPLPSTDFALEGRSADDPGQMPSADVLAVSPGYFGVMGIPLLAGRGIEEQDALGAPVAAVLTRSAAQAFWPGESPLGRRLTLLHWDAPLEARVVGVVGDVRQAGPEAAVVPAVYYSHRQFTDRVLGFYFLARSDEPVGRLAGAIREKLRGVDPDQPASQLARLEDVLQDALAERRFDALLVALFASLALALAVVGVHGLVAWLVSERTREIGVRLALGARPADVRRRFTAKGLRLTLLGVAIGVPAALLSGRAIGSLVRGVSGADPAALGLAALVASLAGRRAAALDPLAALREE